MVEPTLFFIEKISFSLKFFSGHFYGQSFIKTVRGPLKLSYAGVALNNYKIMKSYAHGVLIISLPPNVVCLCVNVRPDLDPNCLTLRWYPERIFQKICFEKNQQTTKRMKKLPGGKEF